MFDLVAFELIVFDLVVFDLIAVDKIGLKPVAQNPAAMKFEIAEVELVASVECLASPNMVLVVAVAGFFFLP